MTIYYPDNNFDIPIGLSRKKIRTSHVKRLVSSPNLSMEIVWISRTPMDMGYVSLLSEKATNYIYLRYNICNA